jgi:hypothetical protein|tara:strand:+ start:18505 stop:18858 length:354 start_codon:yes stop_codon:yes gene_type:complete
VLNLFLFSIHIQNLESYSKKEDYGLNNEWFLWKEAVALNYLRRCLGGTIPLVTHESKSVRGVVRTYLSLNYYLEKKGVNYLVLDVMERVSKEAYFVLLVKLSLGIDFLNFIFKQVFR